MPSNQLMRGGRRAPLLLLAIHAAAAVIMEVEYQRPRQLQPPPLQPSQPPPRQQPPSPSRPGLQQAPPSGPLPCETSGMCSLGKVKPFMGDVVPPATMRSCLEARSFRKELILLTETRLNPAYQTFRSLLALGYEHVALLSSQERCLRSVTTWPRLGCVWSTQKLLNTNKYLMDRVAFMARSGRLGYNVLMLDSDVVPFRDLYSLLWAPPLGDAALTAMKDGNGWLNCGVLYIRNARPDGPAVYVLAEVLDRLERWADAPQFYGERGLNNYCWDQQMYSDTLLSALAGRPVSYGCWLKHDPVPRARWDEAHIRLFNGSDVPTGREGAAQALELRHYLQRQSLPWPPELLTEAPDYPNRGAAETWIGTMRVPNSRGVWPQELGGELYPPGKRAETSRQWMDILRADGGPLWPDPEDPAQADAAAAATETFAYLPTYLTETWSLGGALGYWNPALLRPMGHPPVAMAHFVHVPGGATNKLTVKMASNNWDWDVAHAAHPNRGVFFASTRVAPVPDVLALSPDLVRSEWPTEAAFAAAVLALLRLAMEMGRAAAYPAPRCNLTWLGGEANNKLPLAVHHGFHIPYAPAGKGFDDLRCLWGGYLQHGCQAARPYFPGGLLAPEYDHLLDLLHQDGDSGSSETGLDGGGAASGDGDSTNSSAAASRRASHLASLGFIVGGEQRAVAPGGGGGGGGDDVVTVPAELLRPPAAAAAWDVTQLAAALMERYGGPGSGLLLGNHTGEGGGGGGGGGSSRPRVLVLSAVPNLTDTFGPRHELFRQELESGPDRAFMSCDWIRTGRPYRRRRGDRRRGRAAALRRRRQLLLQDEYGNDDVMYGVDDDDNGDAQDWW